MEHAATLAAPIAAENILVLPYIQMCFPIVAKWASAMHLCIGVADDLDSNQANHILNSTRQIIIDFTRFTSPPIKAVFLAGLLSHSIQKQNSSRLQRQVTPGIVLDIPLQVTGLVHNQIAQCAP